MFTREQEKLLNNFADKSDQLFDLGVITTDSFTGEIGEYVACRHFNLTKSDRVTKAVDGVSASGDRYQIKTKVISKDNFNCTYDNLPNNSFDYLTIVYFDNFYNLLKIIKVSSGQIKNGKLQLKYSNINSFEHIEGKKIKIPSKIKTIINEFANAFTDLQENKITYGRHIVGDIGEVYACSKLNLTRTANRNEKGVDARHQNGLTFEIKTRRVYESERRKSKTRRLNNLVGKTADYLIVVTLDRSFKCSGMWILPMGNLINPKSANLKVVNTTPGTLNLIPSKIDWLRTGDSFKDFTS